MKVKMRELLSKGKKFIESFDGAILSMSA